jgi:hypothetical protein
MKGELGACRTVEEQVAAQQQGAKINFSKPLLGIAKLTFPLVPGFEVVVSHIRWLSFSINPSEKQRNRRTVKRWLLVRFRRIEIRGELLGG